jgi:sigma-B regulation protein RsbU (phosphoserine phosphatase)
MSLQITVVAADASSELKWVHQLKTSSPELAQIEVSIGSQEPDSSKYGQIVFVDGQMPRLEEALDRLDRSGRAIFIIADETSAGSAGQKNRDWSSLILSGKVDDALVFPFRALEVQSKLRHYQQILMWEEVSRLNDSFSQLIARLQDDLRLAERLQKSKSPVRFPEIKGFHVASRYLAGMKSGGDHLDLAEAKAGNQLSVILADSSSYGLSSSLLSVLMRVAMKLSQDEVRSCEETVRRIHEELMLILNDKDHLSLFYGVISRKDYCLRYVNLGSSCAFYAQPGLNFRALPSQGLSLKRGSPGFPAQDFQAELPLEPKGRLALISDGFVQAMGGEAEVLKALNRFRDTESADFLNELVFQLKSKFNEPDDMPEQDCTAALLDVNEKILRKI